MFGLISPLLRVLRAYISIFALALTLLYIALKPACHAGGQTNIKDNNAAACSHLSYLERIQDILSDGYFYRIGLLRTLRPLKSHCKLKIIYTPCFIDIFQWIIFMRNRLAKQRPIYNGFVEKLL